MPDARDPAGEERAETIEAAVRPPAMDPEHEAAYRSAVRSAGLDAVHDVMADSGPDVLAKPLPYLITAARNRRIDGWRRERRAQPVDRAGVDTPAPGSLWDPVEVVAASDELSRTLLALAELDDRDVLVVWLHAQGRSDDDIRDEWVRRGYEPAAPTLEAIRKRRDRARSALRRSVGRTGSPE